MRSPHLRTASKSCCPAKTGTDSPGRNSSGRRESRVPEPVADPGFRQNTRNRGWPDHLVVGSRSDRKPHHPRTTAKTGTLADRAPPATRSRTKITHRAVPCLHRRCGASMRAVPDVLRRREAGNTRSSFEPRRLTVGMLAPKRCKHGTLLDSLDVGCASDDLPRAGAPAGGG